MDFYLIFHQFTELPLAPLLVEELQELKEYLCLVELLYGLHTEAPIPEFIVITRELLESRPSVWYIIYFDDGANN